MHTYRKLAAAASLGVLLGVGACSDYLSGGQLTTDPNRATTATAKNLMVTTQLALFNLWGGDPARVTGIYAQEFAGINRQYLALDQTYSQDPNTTNGLHSSLYSAGGLVDIVQMQQKSAAVNDTLFLGIAQVIEGATMGTGADLFGDLVYSEALKGTPNPKLDPQAQVYDSVQKVLSAAIVNLTSYHDGGNSPNFGPGTADVVYGGDGAKWAAMAHTLKARFYMHNGEVDPANYALALAEAQQGISSSADDYLASYTATPGEKNLYYQFNNEQRGDLGPGGPTIDSLLVAHHDPRRDVYFTANSDTVGDLADFGDFVNDPAYPTPFVTFDENTLIWAEAAYRTGDPGTALTQLNIERANHGLSALSGLTGQALLNEILLEKYVVNFGLGEEAWNDYKRTCTPNLVPHSATKKIPGRLFYDSGEQQTNTNIPPAGTGINGFRNTNDPPNATSDGTGAACLGQ